MIVIDYLQLMTAGGDGGNREQEISTISRSLKMIAKELSVPVIALSQLSRAVETRGGDKKPQLSDLRESGAIEQDADMVTFVYRPEYYNITEDEDGRDLRGTGQIIIAKHRNGGLDTVPLKFTPHLAKFSNLDGDELMPFQEGEASSEEQDDFFGNKTFSSRMNEDENEFGDNDDVPF
jgi:replicative DNA helicase